MGDNVRKMVDELLGKPGDYLPEHIQTVKITATAHAKLRALADLVASKSKTPLAADLLTAAIDDAIEALPDEPLDDEVADKLAGIVKSKSAAPGRYQVGDHVIDIPPRKPRTMRDLVLQRAEIYLDDDQRERWEKEEAVSSEREPVSQNGAHK